MLRMKDAIKPVLGDEASGAQIVVRHSERLSCCVLQEVDSSARRKGAVCQMSQSVTLVVSRGRHLLLVPSVLTLNNMSSTVTTQAAGFASQYTYVYPGR